MNKKTIKESLEIEEHLPEPAFLEIETARDMCKGILVEDLFFHPVGREDIRETSTRTFLQASQDEIKTLVAQKSGPVKRLSAEEAAGQGYVISDSYGSPKI